MSNQAILAAAETAKFTLKKLVSALMDADNVAGVRRTLVMVEYMNDIIEEIRAAEAAAEAKTTNRAALKEMFDGVKIRDIKVTAARGPMHAAEEAEEAALSVEEGIDVGQRESTLREARPTRTGASEGTGYSPAWGDYNSDPTIG